MRSKEEKVGKDDIKEGGSSQGELGVWMGILGKGMGTWDPLQG